jgi:hypothetical protein
MSSLFGKVAEVAVDELIKKHLTPSKYGFFMTTAQFEELKSEFLVFLETSRNLRVAGDQILKNQTGPARDKPRTPSPPSLRGA